MLACLAWEEKPRSRAGAGEIRVKRPEENTPQERSVASTSSVSGSVAEGLPFEPIYSGPRRAIPVDLIGAEPRRAPVPAQNRRLRSIARHERQLVGPRRSRIKKTKTKAERDRETNIRKAITAGKKGRVYCVILDNYKVRIPSLWRIRGCPEKYADAYKSKKWRHLIQNEKSSLTPARLKRTTHRLE